MQLLSRRLSHQIASLTAVSLLTFQPLAAFASPQQSAMLFPENSAVFNYTTLKPELWVKVANELPEEGQELLAELKTGLQEFEKAAGVNLLMDGLIHLGDELSLAYQPVPGQMGHLLFNLELKQGAPVKKLLRKVFSYLQQTPDEDREAQISSQTFGGYTLHQLSFSDTGMPFVFSVTVSKNRVLASFGHSDAGLKNMLFTQDVLAADSKMRLSQEAGFQQTAKVFQGYDNFFYFDSQRLAKVFEPLFEDEIPESKGLLSHPWAQEILNYHQTMGLASEFEQQQLRYKGMIGHNTAQLSAYQKQLISEEMQLQQGNLKPLLQHMPDSAFLVTAGVLSEDTGKDFPTDQPLPEAFAEFKELLGQAQLTTEIGKITQLDLQRLKSELDGRFAMAVLPGQNPKLPHAGGVLQLKPDKAQGFIQRLVNEFRFDTQADPAALFGGGIAVEKAKASSVKANMHTLQTIVETYGVDWGGQYPASLNVLTQEAQNNSSPYWRDVSNPVNGESGLNKSIMPFSEFKPVAEQMGMVYYAPIGEVQKSEDGSFYSTYAIYGYGTDGKLYVLSNNDEQVPHLYKDGYMLVVKDDLPKAPAVPEAERYLRFSSQPAAIEGVEMYSLNLPAEAQKEFAELLGDDSTAIQPTIAQQGELFYFGLNPASVKQLVQTQSSQHSNAHARHQQPSAAPYLFMDFTKAQPLFEAIIPEEDRGELQEILSFLPEFKSLNYFQKQAAGHSQGEVKLNVGPQNAERLEIFGNSPFLMGLLSAIAMPNFIGAQDRAKISSTKANMHTLQTMIETYAVDWGGEYPASLEQLKQEAENPEGGYGSYWKVFTNPQTGKSDLGGAMINHSAYTPGPDMAGIVTYEPVKNTEGSITLYFIYGADKKGKLIEDKGEVFSLSNS